MAKRLVDVEQVLTAIKEHFDARSQEFDQDETTVERKHEINGSLTTLTRLKDDVQKLPTEPGKAVEE